MNITEKQYDDVELFYEGQRTTAGEGNDANRSLQDWGGQGSFFDSVKYSTRGERQNREMEIDDTWARIAKLSRERWSKENPY